MIKTVIFGGTFDPPHAGHKNILKSVMSHGYDRAIVIPDKIPPHKAHARDDFDNRYALTKKLFSDMGNVTVSDIENRRDGKSYTSDTLDELRRMYPDDELYLLVGSDMLFTIENWHESERILKTTPIISCARRAQDRKPLSEHAGYLEKKYGCRVTVYDPDIIDMSSSELRSPLVTTIKKHNEDHLKPERLTHVISVAEYAVLLAGLHGIDTQDAYIAGLAHDCTKYLDTDGQNAYFAENGITLTDDERACPKIYHQISGAHFAEHTLGIENRDILNAIRYHTTGRAGMSELEKLICLADSIEPRRDYANVGKMRKIARTDLDTALLMSFDRLIEYIKQRGLKMNGQTLAARDWLKERIKNG